MTDVALNFGINCYTGWGIVGMAYAGLMREFQPISVAELSGSHLVGMDPLRYSVIERVIKASQGWDNARNSIWIDSVGNDLRPPTVEAKVNIGRVIIEKPDRKAAMNNLSQFDRLLTGSTWNADLIEEISGRRPKVILEGIDPSLFCPGPKSGWLDPDCFYIYSAGKVEFRKAQDVVLMAFKTFSERHPEARLITCWNSPFSDLGNGYQGIAKKPLWMAANNRLDIKRWASDNGIDHDKVQDIGCFPNFVLPQILREMDVMLSPTRVESCQCLPVLESLSCDIRTIYAEHSGMLDLGGVGYTLTNNKPINGSSEYFFPRDEITWYEPDLDEIDAALEDVYNGYGDHDFDAVRTWETHVKELEAWLKE
jgi:glycosyltransferase involved in cell wall biosynthesis